MLMRTGSRHSSRSTDIGAMLCRSRRVSVLRAPRFDFKTLAYVAALEARVKSLSSSASSSLRRASWRSPKP